MVYFADTSSTLQVLLFNFPGEIYFSTTIFPTLFPKFSQYAGATLQIFFFEIVAPHGFSGLYTLRSI